MAAPADSSHSLSLGIRVGYGFGGVGTGLFAVLPGLLLMFYMTDTLGVPATIATLAVTLPKLWDAFSDPLMGIISDRTTTRWGRRRPYMLAGAIILPIGFWALFTTPEFATPTQSFAYVLAVFLVCTTAFTLFSVPFVAMPAEMTQDYDEATGLMTWRTAFMTVGILVAGTGSMIVAAGGGGREGYALMAVVVALVCFTGLITAVLSTKRAPFATRAEATVPLREQIKIALANRPFFFLVVAYVIQLIGVGCILASVTYFAKYHVVEPGQPHGDVATFLTVALVVPAILVMPLWSALSRRIGKKRAFGVAILGFGVLAAGLYGAGSRPPAILYPHVALMGVCFAGLQLFPFAMLPDTMQLDRARSGLRREGVFSGLWMAADKGGVALGVFVVGQVLGSAGFIESKDQLVTQPDSALSAIGLLMSVVPAGFMLVSLLVLTRYDLPAERVQALAAADDRADAPP